MPLLCFFEDDEQQISIFRVHVLVGPVRGHVFALRPGIYGVALREMLEALHSKQITIAGNASAELPASTQRCSTAALLNSSVAPLTSLASSDEGTSIPILEGSDS